MEILHPVFIVLGENGIQIFGLAIRINLDGLTNPRCFWFISTVYLTG